MRQAGILFPISCLPSKSGIGDFGPEAYKLVDWLEKTGVGIWQILPLNPLGFGYSPYQTLSSYAIEPLYLSLELLEKEGLIEKAPQLAVTDSIDYQQVQKLKEPYYKEAFSNFKPNKEYIKFQKRSWVKKYAIFMALKKKNELRSWTEWEITSPKNLSKKEIEFEIFLQYELFQQWFKLKSYANKRHLSLMGDIPFYVGLDSADVYYHQQDFLLDQDTHQPTSVAGVPPDYFSATGQRWGNPIYNWPQLKKEHYSFWLDRLGQLAGMVNIIRIDHFRAFDTYWRIPQSCSTAIEGKWEEAPGYEFLTSLKRKYPRLQIIAEDLGLLRPQVGTLRDYFHLKGMRVVEFSFDPKHIINPNLDKKNSVIYTGTHDNQPLLAWYKSFTTDQQEAVKESFRQDYHLDLIKGFIHYTLSSSAQYAIIPIWDYLGLDDKARLNTPGTVGKPNWCWRLTDLALLNKDEDWYAKEIKTSGRSRKSHK